MANSTMDPGACAAPFLPLSQFPYSGGFEAGRLCAPLPTPEGSSICCLPCPLNDWVYPDNFSRLSQISNWLNVVGIICSTALLLSFVVLPVEKTHRHYLTICLILGVVLMELSFIIPFGAKPNQCHDPITPNDMQSDVTCAISGTLIVLGGWVSVMWVFLRSVSLHLQICWEVIPGRRFFYGALLVGWGIPALFIAIALPVTGVSYRFGTTCHINHDRGLQDFWGPLLGLAGATTVFQFVTFGYCIKVYIKSLLRDDSTQNSSQLPSYHGSIRTVTPKAAYRRVRKVIALQWRGIAIVLIIIADVVFFSVIFVALDNKTQAETQDVAKVQPWLSCLLLSGGNKNACLDKASGLVINEATVLAVLILLSMNGIWGLLFLGRWSMVTGWIQCIRGLFRHNSDFVSVDARRVRRSSTAFEMITSPPQAIHLPPKSPESMISPVDDKDSIKGAFSPLSPADSQGGYFGAEAKYNSPTYSFSSPKVPSRSTSATTRRDTADSVTWRDWDPRSTHAQPWQDRTGTL